MQPVGPEMPPSRAGQSDVPVRDEVELDEEASRRAPRHTHRRLVRPTLVLALLCLALLVGLVLFSLISARSELLEGRDAARRGLTALRGGETAAAIRAFEQAENSFADGRAAVDGLAPSLAAWIPGLGRNLEAAAAQARAAELATSGAQVVSAALNHEQTGFEAFLPRLGRIPLKPISRLQQSLEEAHSIIERAIAQLDASPGSWLLPSLAKGRADLDSELVAAESALAAGEALARSLPSFLGAEGTRRYFLGAQNPAELRGTGGFLGVFTTVEVRNGRMRLADFTPIEDLADLPISRVVAPNPDFAARYNEFGGAGFWRNINMTPDFPSAATAIERLYPKVGGKPLDGTIFVDPHFLASLMPATGAIEVPGAHRTVEADEIVDYVTNRAYGEFDSRRARKRLLGEFAGRAFDRFLSGKLRGGSFETIRALGESAAGGHLLLHARDNDVQRSFDIAGLSGGLAQSRGDYLAVIANNSGANKVDYYVRRNIDYRVALQPDGSALSSLEIELQNRAPRRGEPPIVIGPYADISAAGESVTNLSVYGAPSGGLEGFWRDERRQGVGSSSELGRRVYDTAVRISSRRTARLRYEFSIRDAWQHLEGTDTYSLAFDNQPTIRPTRFSFEVRVPNGARIEEASAGMSVHGDRAVWKGIPHSDLYFEVRFARPWYREAIDLLNRPLFRFGS